MGSGIVGLMTIRDLFGLDTEIVGVVAERCTRDRALVRRGGARQHRDRSHAHRRGCDSCSRSGGDRRDRSRRGAVVQISEEQCVEAMRLIMRCTHHLVEPSGAAALAGLIVDQAIGGNIADRRLGAIVSGGNVDASVLAEILAGRTPSP